MRVRDVSESWGESGPPASVGEEAPILPRLLLGIRRRAAIILFVWLAVAGLLNSALSVFYYARILRTMYMEDPPATEPAMASASSFRSSAHRNAARSKIS